MATTVTFAVAGVFNGAVGTAASTMAPSFRITVVGKEAGAPNRDIVLAEGYVPHAFVLDDGAVVASGNANPLLIASTVGSNAMSLLALACPQDYYLIWVGVKMKGASAAATPLYTLQQTLPPFAAANKIRWFADQSIIVMRADAAVTAGAFALIADGTGQKGPLRESVADRYIDYLIAPVAAPTYGHYQATRAPDAGMSANTLLVTKLLTVLPINGVVS
jgi:hypothetical protein